MCVSRKQYRLRRVYKSVAVRESSSKISRDCVEKSTCAYSGRSENRCSVVVSCVKYFVVEINGKKCVKQDVSAAR